ncbi:hypothetical protein [Moraxella sp. TY6]
MTGQSLGFAVLVICTTILELKGHSTQGLWIGVVLWAFFGNFNGK